MVVPTADYRVASSLPSVYFTPEYFKRRLPLTVGM